MDIQTQPCGAMELHKTSLPLPTQSYPIAHHVCVGQFPGVHVLAGCLGGGFLL